MADQNNVFDMPDDKFLENNAELLSGASEDQESDGIDETDASSDDQEVDETNNSDTNDTEDTDTSENTTNDDTDDDNDDDEEESLDSSEESTSNEFSDTDVKHSNKKEEKSNTDDSDDSDSTSEDESTNSSDNNDIDYAAIGKQVMSEFKANGTTMKAKSVDDVIRLMQMGANYNKKMAGMKPALKTLKLLEKHELLDPEKINFLIDLSQKKPEAINKLLKDSDIDPMDIDLEQENDYSPENRTISDKELLLDEVLDEIKESPAYERTLNVIGNDWDEESKRILVDDPNLIRIINSHIESGIFDKVISTVQYEKSVGRLSGISDFAAYIQVGEALDKQGAFSTTDAENTAESDNKNSTKNSNTKEITRKAKKKSVSPSRSSKKAKSKNNEFNPLEMSDEEFIALRGINV